MPLPFQRNVPSTTSTIASSPNMQFNSPQRPSDLETFVGFIKDASDARLLVEAVVAGVCKPVLDLPIGMTSFPLRSGSIVVFPEGSQETLRVRWRDGATWSSSKVNGAFLLYRQVEPKSSNSPPVKVDKSSLFAVTAVRAQHQLVLNGFAKRTISVVGSNGQRYRVINYFLVQEVADHYAKHGYNASARPLLPTPSQLPEFDCYVHLLRHNNRCNVRTPSLESVATPIYVPNVNNVAPLLDAIHRFEAVATPLPPQNGAVVPLVESIHRCEAIVSPLIHQRVVVEPLVEAIQSEAEGSEQLSRFHYEAYRFGGSALQVSMKYFTEHPNWAEGPVYLQPLARAQY
ncbi:hypothetical protein BC830DRAFT_1143949 [Chytriomyces sp. MP71]|nr:hypothetical protein BC830DRAFT_1143949 [Chytriomyces sp. MP71]